MNLYWAIWRVSPYGGDVEWYTGPSGWSKDWTERRRIKDRALAMSKLWKARAEGAGHCTLVKVSQRTKKGPHGTR
jgi:hypothetical protein